MKGFDILKIKSAVKARNKFSLDCDHLTTMNFGQIVPLYSVETVPGDEFNINASFFSRMAPLVKPTYGKFQFKTVTAFVPYHQIADDAEAWLAGKTTWLGSTPLHRFIYAGELFGFIKNNCCTSTGATSANCDVSYKDSSETTKYLVFTSAGRFYVKVLNALGYAIPQGVNEKSGSDWNNSGKTVKFSAYPLLAFFKLYNDYMSQSQRYNSSQLSNILNCIKHGKTVTGYYPSTGQVANAVLLNLFVNLKLNYENDYFTSAWMNPTAPLNSVEDLGSAVVPGGTTNTGSLVQRNSADNYLVTQGANSVHIGQRALDFLKDFDDWVRRNNYSGSRDVQQIYSRFGIKTDDFRSNYAHVYKTDSMPIQVGDVTATADSSDVQLGDYSGKGIMSGSSVQSIKVDDYGMIFMLGYFTVTPMNPYGYDRSVLRTAPLDYYNPEFDGIGGDAISLGEVYASPIAFTEDNDATKDTDVFGFTERYNSYRYGRDRITGDFRNFHNDSDMNVWHTGRLLSSVRADGDLVAQSSTFNTMEQTDSQFNRIFSITDDSVDRFYLTCRFNVSAIRPMLNLNQVVKLGEGDTVVPRNGNVIS